MLSLPGVVTSLTGDGATALGYRENDSGLEAFRWTERGGVVPLWSIDSVLWERPAFFVQHPLEYQPADEEFDLGAWSPFAWFMTAAAPAPPAPSWSESIGQTGLSMDGSVVVGSTYRRGLIEAYRSSPEKGFEHLGSCPGSESSRADFVSRNSEVIVGRCGAHWESQIFRWTREDGMRGLGTGTATGISGDGSLIVGYSRGFRSAMRGFVWREETGITLFPGGTESCVPWGASFDGSSIIGGSCDYADGTHGYGFIWNSSSGLRDIDRLLSSLRRDGGDRHFIPLAISDDGRTLAGRILSPATGYAGWIARLSLSREQKPAEQGPLPISDVPDPRRRGLGAPLVGAIATGVAATLLWYYLVLASTSASLAASRGRGRRT